MNPIIETINNNDPKYILTHWQNSIEIILVLSGELHCLINGREYTLGKNDVCIINQNQLHKIYQSNDKKAEYRSISFDRNLLTANEEIQKNYIIPVVQNKRFTHIIFPAIKKISKEIAILMNCIHSLEGEKEPSYELLIVAYLHIIFQKLYITYKEREYQLKYESDEDNLLYRHMATYIYQHYSEKLYVKDIAKSVNISKNKCFLIFKKYTKQSPMEFLNCYRLEIGKNLLENTDEDIASIALKCGFAQQSYFGSSFLKQYAITPKKYRKEKREYC